MNYILEFITFHFRLIPWKKNADKNFPLIHGLSIYADRNALSYHIHLMNYILELITFHFSLIPWKRMLMKIFHISNIYGRSCYWITFYLCYYSSFLFIILVTFKFNIELHLNLHVRSRMVVKLSNSIVLISTFKKWNSDMLLLCWGVVILITWRV